MRKSEIRWLSVYVVRSNERTHIFFRARTIVNGVPVTYASHLLLPPEASEGSMEAFRERIVSMDGLAVHMGIRVEFVGEDGSSLNPPHTTY